MTRAHAIMVILIAVIGWPFLAHSGDVPLGGSLFVYNFDGTNHCESHTGVDLIAMGHQLTDTGITVISMRKGFDGREGIAVCGSPTGQINIYEIPAADLQAVLSIGFKRLPENMSPD